MAEEIKITVVDSFTDSAYCGNPAAVVVDSNAAPLTEAQMQHIAREMNLSETSFTVLHSIDEAQREVEYNIRWFTPTTEVPLCGHATLATAHALFTEYETQIGDAASILFHTRESGDLRVKRAEGGGYEMDFPLNTPVITRISNDLETEIRHQFNVPEDAIFEETAVSNRTKKLLIRVANLSSVLALKPTSQCFPNSLGVRGVIFTTCDKSCPLPHPNVLPGQFDFISRYFAPWNGIPEDPVTGAAHTVLAGYWAAQLSRTLLHAYQASPRGGRMSIEVSKEKDRVTLTGQATTVLRGHLVRPSG